MEIVHSRWEDYLPKMGDGVVDLIYTDPPYGKAYRSNIPGSKEWNKSGESKSRFKDHIKGDVAEEFAQIDWGLFFAECHRVLRDDRYLFLHCSMELFSVTADHLGRAGFKYKGALVWDKKVSFGGDLTGAMQRNWEPVAYWAKGNPKLNRIKVNGVIKDRISETREWGFSIKRAEYVGHPTQKPLGLARRIISIACPQGGVVFDPFAGSGTAGIASMECGRESICVEWDMVFYEKMKKRHEKVISGMIIPDYNETV